MMSAIVYLTLGALLSRLEVKHPRLRLYFIIVPLFLTGIVGASRVYLGVHYPTDVLAGWTAGLVWATLCFLVAQRLQRAEPSRRSFKVSLIHPSVQFEISEQSLHSFPIFLVFLRRKKRETTTEKSPGAESTP